MTRSAALATGWLADRTSGCELGGPPLPIDYAFTGPKAPAAVKGTAEFTRGRLTSMAFSRGVTTTKGVRVGVSTIARMVAAYRSAPFHASSRFDSTFVGTFVTVRRGSRTVMGGFAEKKIVTVIGIPFVPVCE